MGCVHRLAQSDFVSIASLEGLKKIRCKAYGPYIHELEIACEGIVYNSFAYDSYFGTWKEVVLEKDEFVIGIYGDYYNNFRNHFKQLGFILGKYETI